MPNSIRCIGELTTVSGYPQCSGQWDVVFQQPPFDPSQLDPVFLAQAFGAGFTLVATSFLVTLGARVVLNFIKTF
jgi:hypothetical protein